MVFKILTAIAYLNMLTDDMNIHIDKAEKQYISNKIYFFYYYSAELCQDLNMINMNISICLCVLLCY